MKSPLRKAQVVVLVLAAACGGSDSGPASTTAPVKDPNIVGPSGGTVTAGNGAATLSIPAGALSADVKITMAPTADPANDTRTSTATPYEFGPEGTKFAQPVTLTLRYDRTKLPPGGAQSELRVAQYSDVGWIPVEQSFAIDSATGSVKIAVTELGGSSSHGRLMAITETAIPGGTLKNWHKMRPIYVPYYPPANPCQPVVLESSQVASGQLLSGDCVESGNNGRRSDYYSVSTNAQTVLSIRVEGAITGPFGLAASGLSAYASSTVGNTLTTLVPAGTWRVFVSGTDSTTRGSYTISTSTSSAARSGCENLNVIAGQTVSGVVQATDCSTSVPQSSPNPTHRGQTLYYDLYRVRLFAGKSYTISAAQSGAGANACLIVWQGSQMAASVLDKGPETNPKTVTITPPADLYYTVEVESCSTVSSAWTPAAMMPYSVTISP